MCYKLNGNSWTEEKNEEKTTSKIVFIGKIGIYIYIQSKLRRVQLNQNFIELNPLKFLDFNGNQGNVFSYYFFNEHDNNIYDTNDDNDQ